MVYIYFYKCYNKQSYFRQSNSGVNMYSIYQFRIKGYGVYVCQTNNLTRDLNRQLAYLNGNKHHNLVLQYLYNKFPLQFVYQTVQRNVDPRYLTITTNIHRRKFPFTIDSPFSHIPLDTRVLRTKYELPVHVYVMEDGLSVISKNGKAIGLEMAHNFQSGNYIKYKLGVYKV